MAWWYEHGEAVKDFVVAAACVAVGVFIGTLLALFVAFLKWF